MCLLLFLFTVQSFMRKAAFIATQLPLEQTVSDFLEHVRRLQVRTHCLPRQPSTQPSRPYVGYVCLIVPPSLANVKNVKNIYSHKLRRMSQRLEGKQGATAP